MSFVQLRGVWISGCGVPVRRVRVTLRERRKGYEGGVQLAYRGGFVHYVGTHRPVDETHLVGVVSHTRMGDGADFEVMECQQWRFGASVDFDSGVGVRVGLVRRNEGIVYHFS